MTIIDSHLHLWDLATGEYGWPDMSVPAIRRTFTVDDVAPLLRAEGIDGVVLVQAADSAGDTRRMLGAADRDPIVAGVVGWIPLDRPDEADHLLAEFMAHPAFVGVRALTHGYPDPEWILRPELSAVLGRLESSGLSYDIVTADSRGLDAVPRLASRHPELRLVIDHLGKPPIGGDPRSRRDWRERLARAAVHPRVVAKISGLYGPAYAPAGAEAIRPFVEDALELFGPARLMAGSDWPVCELAGGHRWIEDALDGVLGTLSAGDRSLLRGGTAAHVYRLDVRCIGTAEGNAG